MPVLSPILWPIIFCVVGAAAQATTLPQATTPPHIIFLLSDDLGWSNVGFHNPRVHTPALDGLRAEGVELTRHYAYKFCSPSRCSFLSGRLPVHVNEHNRPTEAPLAGVPVDMTLIGQKLKQALPPYATHHVGKWHGGFGSRSRNLPGHRGFDTSLGYFHGAEDHYTQREGGNVQCAGAPPNGFVDLWATNATFDGPSNLNGTDYSMHIYRDHALALLAAHDPKTPFFMYLAFNNNHDPLQVPDQYKSSYSLDNAEDWINYQAMITAVDTVVENVTALLHLKGMWNNSLVVWTSDNGGPVYQGGGGNNFPFRGGKISNFEGGIRVPAFVSGGVVPLHRKNTSFHGITHIADWYTTFCSLAHVDPVDKGAAAAGLPAVDGKDLSQAIFLGDVPSPWSGIPILISSTASDKQINPLPSSVLMLDNFKLIIGTTLCTEWASDLSPNVTHPNGTCVKNVASINYCPTGCLFDVMQDPGEHVDLAQTQPDTVRRLRALLEQEATKVYNPWRGDPAPACEAARAAGGVWSPFLP